MNVDFVVHEFIMERLHQLNELVFVQNVVNNIVVFIVLRLAENRLDVVVSVLVNEHLHWWIVMN